MQYMFPSDLRDRIEAQLALGIFSSEDDVLREAIETLEKRQQGQRRLRQMVQDAEAEIAAGSVDTFNADATKDAIRQRLLRNGVRP